MDPKKQLTDFWSSELDRRELLKTLGVVGSVMALSGPSGLAQAMAQRQAATEAGLEKPAAGAGSATEAIPRRALGNTGVEVSVLCFGGAHWGRMSTETEAIRVLHEAIEAGVTFMDNAWEYNGGRSEEWMGKGLQGRRQQVFLMTKVCSHGRDKKVALQQLEESLRRLRTDYLDLWQLHEVIYDDDPIGTLRPAEPPRRCSRPSGRARSGSSDLRATKIRRSISRCWRTTFRSRPANCR